MVERGQEPKLVGKGDGVLVPQEVYRYVLDNYRKYRNLLARKAGIYYPYALPAKDKRTKAQREFYSEVKTLAATIERELNSKGIERGEEKFQDAMYSALLYAIRGEGTEQREGALKVLKEMK